LPMQQTLGLEDLAKPPDATPPPNPLSASHLPTYSSTHTGTRGMGCTQAEILRLLELIEDDVFARAKDLEDAWKRFSLLKEHLKQQSLDELRARLGLA